MRNNLHRIRSRTRAYHEVRDIADVVRDGRMDSAVRGSPVAGPATFSNQVVGAAKNKRVEQRTSITDEREQVDWDRRQMQQLQTLQLRGHMRKDQFRAGFLHLEAFCVEVDRNRG